jgi:hypothetical protein
MTKSIIIGSGFSALIANILLDKKSLIISPKKNLSSNNKNLKRRRNLECNKLMAPTSRSYGSIKYSLLNGRLHDRLIPGGNSQVWGGAIDLTKIPNNFLTLLHKNKIYLRKLSYNETGSISNIEKIYQIQGADESILSAESRIYSAKNAYLEKIIAKRKKIILGLYPKEKITTQRNVLLCIGAIQLIDLLYRSKLIGNQDKIELDEFKYMRKFNFGYPSRIFATTDNVIRFRFGRALGHFLGIQRNLFFFKILDFVPMYLDTYFMNSKLKIKLSIKGGEINDLISNSSSATFGDTIHYCNMHINNININSFLSKLNPNLVGLGMPFVSQTRPGPISNIIIIDALRKLSKYHILKK